MDSNHSYREPYDSRVHKWEQIRGQRTCAICGLISSLPYYTNDDKLIRCANYQKEYQAKPKKEKKRIKSSGTSTSILQ